MPVQDLDDFTDKITIELGSLASSVGADAFERCSDKTLEELQWAYPVTDPFKSYWIVQRGKRHLIQIFMIESAHKFKYKQIHLNQRFDHYFVLLKNMDEEFLRAIEENPGAFPSSFGGIAFPFYIANTFTYDFLGKDQGI